MKLRNNSSWATILNFRDFTCERVNTHTRDIQLLLSDGLLGSPGLPQCSPPPAALLEAVVCQA